MHVASRVLVVRHAIAGKRNPRRWPDDALRPLTPRGERRFRRALRGLQTLVGSPEEVWTSPLTRARQTASLGEKSAGWPAARVVEVLSPGLPSDALGAALRARLGARRKSSILGIVGHEPGLGRFLAWCLGASESGLALRKGGAAMLCFDTRVRRGGARLEWLVTPKMLRQLGQC